MSNDEYSAHVTKCKTLNERAMRGELHLSAVSIHAYAHLLDKYALLPCGASMGDGYGPMFVALQNQGPAADASLEEKKTWLRSKKIAIPGLMTSAYLRDVWSSERSSQVC